MTARDTTAVLDQLIESFLERQRRGERPSVAEYVDQHPELAHEIREVLDALLLMEDLGAPGPATGSFPPNHPSAAAIPANLGEFKILREVGRGGMGIVYEALQRTLGRHVALKVLPPQTQAKPAYIERFRREAQAAARLHHTNIVPVFAVGEHDGVAFYAMQFIRGQTLDAVLQELRGLGATKDAPPAAVKTVGALSAAARRLCDDDPSRLLFSVEAGATVVNANGRKEDSGVADSANTKATRGSGDSTIFSTEIGKARYWRNIANLGVQVADALAYAHGQGLIHRDIKPSNLMLDELGIVWVTDFGLAKFEGSSDLTNPGDILGTLRYMAPEQLGGNADARSDIYALGATLYELATLQPAFDRRDRLRLMDDIRTSEPVRPRKVDPHLPRDLETIILKAMAKEPHRRYLSAAELAEDLRRFLADKPVQARPAGSLEHGWRWCRRNRAVASLLAGFLVFLMGVTIASLFTARAFENIAGVAQEAEKKVRIKLWQAKLEEARARSLTRLPGQRVKTLTVLQEALEIGREVGLDENDRLAFRNVAIAALSLPDIVEEKAWTGLPSVGWEITWDFDADFTRWVRPDGRRGVTVHRVADDKLLAALPDIGWPLQVRMAPSGEYVAVSPVTRGVNTKLGVWRISEQGAQLVWEAKGDHPLDFDPASKRVAFVDAESRVVIHDLETGAKQVHAPLGGHCLGMRFSPDGKHIAIVHDKQGKQALSVLQVRSGQITKRFELTDASEGMDWHPDGHLLAFARSADICVYDLLAQREILALPMGTHGNHVKFDAKGEKLISNNWFNMLKVWDVRSGALEHVVPAWGPQICVSPTKHAFIVASPHDDGGFRQLRLEGGDALQHWTAQPRTGYDKWYETLPCLDPQGELVARVFQGKNLSRGVALLDSRTGQLRAKFELDDVFLLGFDEGGHLYTSGSPGLLRWPRSRNGDTTSFGPPVEVVEKMQEFHGAMDRRGTVFAFAAYPRGFLLARPKHPIVTIRPETRSLDVRTVDISPDGRWVLNCNMPDDPLGVRVWEVATGKPVKAFPSAGHNTAYFSPDGQWFWINGGEGRLWRVGDWTEGPAIPGHFKAMTHDNRVVAVGADIGTIRLVHAETGLEFACLTSNIGERLFPQRFSRDGSRLYAMVRESRSMMVWDLRAIRTQLAKLDLDWDLPSFPAEPVGPTPARKVEFRLGPVAWNNVAHRLLNEKNPAAARRAWDESLKIDPDQPRVLYQYAWSMFQKSRTGGDTKEVLRLLNRAIEVGPPTWNMYYLRALAFAGSKQDGRALEDYDRILAMTDPPANVHHARASCLYRMGRLDDAIKQLTVCLAREPTNLIWLNQRGTWRLEANHFEDAAADFRQCLKSNAAHGRTSLHLATIQLLGPLPLRNPSEAQALIDAVVIRYPMPEKNPDRHLTTLLAGIAQYRLGDHAKALEILDNSPTLRHSRLGGTARFFVAMSCFHLERQAEAVKHYHEAVLWRKTGQPSKLEAANFASARQEAMHLLEIK